MSASRCSECGAITASEELDLNAAPGSRRHTLLTSNEAPLDSDSTIVQSVISKARERLAMVEHELSRLRERMRALEEERASLSGHFAILSPLRRMPPEVLGEIFLWTLPSVGDLRLGAFSVADSPWVLTHVSSRWRAVALSTSSLWALLVVDFPRQPRHSLPMVEAQIERAQSLKIHFYGCDESDSQPQIEIFQCLIQHSSRWRELAVGLTSDLIPVLADLRGRLPSLRRLWMEWQSVESQEEVEGIHCFESAPSLVDAGIFNEHRYVRTSLPSHPLTQYNIDGPWEMHQGILTAAPNLVQARIHVSFDDEEGWPEPDAIVDLLCLRRLLVSHADILKYLRAPGLQEIGFSVNEEQEDYLPHLKPFMARSRCTLRKLTFNGTPIPSAVTDILVEYPSVIELVVIILSSQSANNLISHLTVTNSTAMAAISQRLSQISFWCSDDSGIDYILHLHMLQSWWKAEHRNFKGAALLTSLGKGPDAATLHGLNALRQDGMELLVLQGREASERMDGWAYFPTWA
ncbi:hypothetical protein C8R44DRAFT_852255 [Mycena epipterygia]|nr:hypothetical protein C8R44DRAFT_852255 [Mycena epipterygia]